MQALCKQHQQHVIMIARVFTRCMQHAQQALQTGTRIDAIVGQLLNKQRLVNAQIDGLRIVRLLQKVVDGLDDKNAGAEAGARIVELAPRQQLLHERTRFWLSFTQSQQARPDRFDIMQCLGIAENIEEDWTQELNAVVANTAGERKEIKTDL